MGPRIAGTEIYRRFAAHGLVYGPAFQGIAEAWGGAGEALGRIAAPATIEPELGEYRLHPAILDACLQVTLAAIPEGVDGGQAALVPSKADRIRFYGGDDRRVAWCHMRLTHTNARSIVGCFVLLDENEIVIAEIDGLRLRRVELGGASEIPAYHWAYQLRPAAGAEPSATDLPGPLQLAQALAADGSPERREDPDNVRATLDRLAASYARAALAEIIGADGAFTPPALKANGSPPPARARIIARLLARLETTGLATRDGTAWRLAGNDTEPTPTALWREALACHPAHLPSLQLIARCGDALAAILRRAAEPGDVAALEPDADALDQLYDADPLFRDAGDAVARMLRELCRTLPDTRLLRVIEIAGGSGGLTGTLSAALAAERTEYVFTDPSEDAVARAAARFAGLPSLRCATLDLARNLDEQGSTRRMTSSSRARRWRRRRTSTAILRRSRDCSSPAACSSRWSRKPRGFSISPPP